MEENWIKLDFCNVDFEPPIVVWAVDDTRAWINGTTEKERNNCTFDYLRNNIILSYIIPTLQFLQNSWRPFPPFLPPPSLFENCSTSHFPLFLLIWKFEKFIIWIYHLSIPSLYENTMVRMTNYWWMLFLWNGWLKKVNLVFISSLNNCRIAI